MIELYGSENIVLDHLTVFGGFPGLLVDASKNIRLTHSAFRGLAAPWSGRSHMKYLGTASYQIVFRNSQPVNENIEMAWNEFTDDHDFASMRFVKNLQFHHNFVDNFNDDGLECGPKLRGHTIYVYQNRIGPCLGVFQQHEMDKDESPVDHDPNSGMYIFRNVIDQRPGVYYHLPSAADPSGEFLHAEGHVLGDHGGPTYPIMRIYQNTLLRRTPVFRDQYLFGMTKALRKTERDVFNNVLVQTEKVPGVAIAGQDAGHLREGGNVIWGVNDGPNLKANPFAKFRASPLFKESQKVYPAGWTSNDLLADPQFVNLPNDLAVAADLRLKPSSSVIHAGQALPENWPDPLRGAGKGVPDIGALPLGAEPWGVGVDGRLSVFGGPATKTP